MKKTIIIAGLPTEVSVQNMARIAGTFGRLSRVVVHHDRAARGPEAICWITYRRGRDAARAMSGLHGRLVSGRPVEASWAPGGEGRSEERPGRSRDAMPRAGSRAVSGHSRDLIPSPYSKQ